MNFTGWFSPMPPTYIVFLLFFAETTEQTELLTEGLKPPETVKTESVKSKEEKDPALKTSSKFRRRSPQRTDTRENVTNKSSEKTESMLLNEHPMLHSVLTFEIPLPPSPPPPNSFSTSPFNSYSRLCSD